MSVVVLKHVTYKVFVYPFIMVIIIYCCFNYLLISAYLSC